MSKRIVSTDVVTRLSRSNLAAQMSEQIAAAALPILAVLVLHVSAQSSALLQAANTLPFLLLSIPAGLIADRYGRKSLMVGTEVLRAAALLGLMFFFLLGWSLLDVLALLGFLVASGTVVYNVASPALVATLVDKADILTANRRLELARSVAFTAGPPLGGLLVGRGGAEIPFLSAAFLSLCSVYYLARIPSGTNLMQRDVRKPRKHIGHDLAEGYLFISGNKYLKIVIYTALIFNTSWYILLSIFAYYAVHFLRLTATSVGIALGMTGVGMVVGAFLYKLVASRLAFGRQILLGPASAALGASLMLGTTIIRSPVILYIGCFLFGFGPIIWTISTTALRQFIVPHHLMARVSSFMVTTTAGARPLGALIGASLSAYFGVRSCICVMAVGFFVQLAVVSFSPVTRLHSLDDLDGKDDMSLKKKAIKRCEKLPRGA